MTDGKSKPEVAEFDALIADPLDKEKMIAKQNMAAQEELNRRLGMQILAPPKRKPSDGNGNGKPH